MNDIIHEIGKFIFVENKPDLCDVIMVVGGSHPELGGESGGTMETGICPAMFCRRRGKR